MLAKCSSSSLYEWVSTKYLKTRQVCCFKPNDHHIIVIIIERGSGNLASSKRVRQTRTISRRSSPPFDDHASLSQELRTLNLELQHSLLWTLFLNKHYYIPKLLSIRIHILSLVSKLHNYPIYVIIRAMESCEYTII